MFNEGYGQGLAQNGWEEDLPKAGKEKSTIVEHMPDYTKGGGQTFCLSSCSHDANAA